MKFLAIFVTLLYTAGIHSNVPTKVYPVVLSGLIDEFQAHVIAHQVSNIPPEAEINLTIFSYGGNVADIEPIIRAFDGHKVNVICMLCASAAFVISQAFDGDRIIYENSKILAHEVRVFIKDGVITKTNAKEIADALSEMDNLLWDVIGRHTNMKKEDYFAAIAGQDWWLSPEEALKYNFFNKIY